MRISIVNGFFLPVPPLSGGATEKSWYMLAREFAARGHTVTMISRRWPNCPNEETTGGIRHLRLPGTDHHRELWRNLLADFFWSWRAFFALPAADIVVVNAVALPIWLGRLKPRAGRVVLMTGRMPKGQYRHYHRIARILAPSRFVRDKVLMENPSLAAVARVCGYPINWQLMKGEANRTAVGPSTELTIGFIGRLHEEKGLLLLADAVNLVRQTAALPAWCLLVCGPSDIARGGSGPAFRQELTRRISAALPANQFTLLEPEFDEATLAGIYRQISIFCYPSLAAEGETFGVGVAEAMAAGAVPVVSQLSCFTDFVHDGKNGLAFDHTAPDAAAQLASKLLLLLREPALRQTLARAAQHSVSSYDFPSYAESLLTDFTTLTTSVSPSSSSP